MHSSTDLHTNNHFDCVVIGGGASGMAAALFAQRFCKKRGYPPISIAVFERNDRCGKKLLTTGNGRCNITNLGCSLENFHGSTPEFAMHALNEFPPSNIVGFFESIGVPCTVEEVQKVFPATLHASSVLDALRLALDENAIRLIVDTKITSLQHTSNQFCLVAESSKAPWTASAVIIATGGKCAPATGSDGLGYRLLTAFDHAIVPPLPSIVQLATDTRFVKPLSGNKIRSVATLLIDDMPVRTEPGEILFTDYGLSGPPILQLSGYVSRALHNASSRQMPCAITIQLDFLPAQSISSVNEMLLARRECFRDRTLEEFLTGHFHRRLAYGLLKFAVQKPLSSAVAELTDAEIDRLARACKALPIGVTGTMSFAHAQTTAGGIATADFDASTMASQNCRGLFACGEVLDIDGDCGGFNLQWAWASGFLAGRSAVTFLRGEKHELRT